MRASSVLGLICVLWFPLVAAAGAENSRPEARFTAQVAAYKGGPIDGPVRRVGLEGLGP
jgi:hypothetical protein